VLVKQLLTIYSPTQFGINWNSGLFERLPGCVDLQLATVPFQNQQELAWAASFILVHGSAY